MPVRRPQQLQTVECQAGSQLHVRILVAILLFTFEAQRSDVKI